jgi:hypothetical protein
MKNNELLIKGSPKLITGKMLRENEKLQQTLEYSIMVSDLVSNESRYGIHHQVGKYMKIFSYLFLFTGLMLVLNSCMDGYVSSEPTYTEYARPQRPSEAHIWIDGDWGWNSQSHVYVQKAGYWDMPRHGHTYVSGSWQTSPKGKSWSKGHWQRDNNQNYNRKQNYKNTDNRR